MLYDLLGKSALLKIPLLYIAKFLIDVDGVQPAFFSETFGQTNGGVPSIGSYLKDSGRVDDFGQQAQDPTLKMAGNHSWPKDFKMGFPSEFLKYFGLLLRAIGNVVF